MGGAINAYTELQRTVSQYRMLTILAYGKYCLRKDIATCRLMSHPSQIPNLNELIDRGCVVCVKDMGKAGRWYNITPKGEEVRKEFESFLEEESPENVLRSKDEVIALIAKNFEMTQISNRIIMSIKKDREENR